MIEPTAIRTPRMSDLAVLDGAAERLAAERYGPGRRFCRGQRIAAGRPPTPRYSGRQRRGRRLDHRTRAAEGMLAEA